jgi:hypothetical protein
VAIEDVILATEDGFETLSPLIPLERAEGEARSEEPSKLEASVVGR